MDSASPRAAIRAWPIWLPCLALIPVGLMARLEARPALALGFAVAVVALAGIALAWAVAKLATRRVPRGLGLTALALNLLLVGVAGAAVARGVVERNADDARAEKLRGAQIAARELGGWVGGAVVNGVFIQATQIDPSSELGKMMREDFTEAFIPIVFTVDNRSPGEVVVDVSNVTLLHADGTSRPVLDRAGLVASARHGSEELKSLGASVYRIPAGARLGSGLVFAPEERFEDVVALDLDVGGRPVALRGRWLTAEQKRAMREHAAQR